MGKKSKEQKRCNLTNNITQKKMSQRKKKIIKDGKLKQISTMNKKRNRALNVRTSRSRGWGLCENL